MYCILIYDIKNEGDGARISRNVYKTCKKYLTHIQNSVFEGDLSEVQVMKLSKELKSYLRILIDSCIIFSSRNQKWLDKTFLTTVSDNVSSFI